MTTLTFEVTEEEALVIRARAKAEGLTVPEYVRQRATGEVRTKKKPRRIRCPHTGAMIFAALSDQPRLTTKAVRELLAAFP